MSTNNETDGADGAQEEISREEAEELIEEIERRRALKGLAALAVAVIGISFSLFQLALAARSFTFTIPLPFVENFQVSLQLLQANAIHVAFALVLTFLMFPASMGDGFVSRSLGRLVDAVEDAFGADNPLATAFDRLRGAFRWAFLDPDRSRVTPFDVLCMVAAALSALYFLMEFPEIQDMRVFGLESGRPVTEIYTFLEPVLGGVPFISEYSYAMILGVVGVLLVLEATRRTLGLPLMLIVATFIVYARWGYLISTGTPFLGLLAIPELTWPDIVQNLWYNTENGVFGIPVTVSVSFIYIFILFGSFLEMSGAGQWFIDLAYAATGKRKGGPAKASILASGFMGTISGSSIANTVTTGAFTIPLMKRSGYSPEFSGAVESSASSGGQILPPVMGAAAFLMVQYTATPFREIIILATVPAVVFFFGVWVMVHFKAVQEGIGGLEETTPVVEHMKKGWFYLVPIFLLLYYLIIERLSVSRSAWFTLVALVALITFIAAYSEKTRAFLLGSLAVIVGVELASYVVAGVAVTGLLAGSGGSGVPLAEAASVVLPRIGWYAMLAGAVTMLVYSDVQSKVLDLNPTVQEAAESAGRRGGRDLGENQLFRVGTFVVKSMEEGARTAVPVVVAVAAAGIIPGVISVSGLGPNLTSLLLALSGGSIVVMLLVTAVASIILGMGMPTTVTYIILISMLATPLVEFGIPLLAAHLFILYFGVIADITPPVAVAAYAASGVAKSDPFETGVKAFSLSLNKAIVPFAFVLAPGIVLLRQKENAAELPIRDQYRVVNFTDLAELSYSIPEILIPIIGVFLGVVALGATVIGTLYGSVNRAERTAFAFSSLLLMAPRLLSESVFGVLGLAGVTVSVDALLLDLALRGVGFVLFVALVTKNRRESESAGGRTEVEAASA
ncbi:TRAP transporter permease [Halobellus limi]|uniref:TRAP transporter permease n=1 Tax=Halobellus limi TaxID=699433 RepID=A0A1H6CST1_9EURY|nr:TRAP transporter fused permease subunit [Halobellus limi]QCC49107.1 TRAP transporter permease [Halobellus limi]SEG75713.1 TRAP transporter, 4TM/12TM fusion protein [Halobellus limi]